jgi:hypothetical protein
MEGIAGQRWCAVRTLHLHRLRTCATKCPLFRGFGGEFEGRMGDLYKKRPPSSPQDSLFIPLFPSAEKCLSVNVLPMGNLDYLNEQILIFDGIEDAVTSLSHPVLILPGYFFASEWTGVLSQLADALDHPLSIPFQRNGFDVFDRRRLDQKPISCHAAPNLSGLPQKAGWAHPCAPRRRPNLPHLQPN